MSADIAGIMKEMVNNQDWRFCADELFLNWADPLEKDIESNNKEPCSDGHFPVAIDHYLGQRS